MKKSVYIGAIGALLLSIIIAFPGFSSTATLRTSTDANRWVDKGSITSTAWSSTANYLEIIPDSQYQVIEGFGGCFNEMGWGAMLSLSQAGRDSIMSALFDTTGCNLTFCRVPMGGNDYCIGNWGGSYDYDPTAGDYTMAKFSISHDYKYYIPYIKAAMKYQPGLRLWTSPWVIPTWIAEGIGGGDKKAYAALALYYEKYVFAYRAEGLQMTAVALHNEPDITGPWENGAMQADFVKNYWGPLFVKDNVPAEMWLGTYWNPDHLNAFILPVLNDADANKYLAAVGIQWQNPSWGSTVHGSYPGKRIIETEAIAWNEPPDWSHGMNYYNNMYQWLSNWCNVYSLWQMVKNPDPQSQPITISGGSVTYTPQFYVTKHFTHYVKPNARRIKTIDNSGITGNKIAFQNTTGDVILVMASTNAAAKQITLKVGDQKLQADIAANSINTFRITIPGAVDKTPHPVPSGLAAKVINTKTIGLRWNKTADVSYYIIYRNGVKVGQTWDTAYSDTGLQAQTSYTYQVSAVNMLMTEGAKSAQVTVGTTGTITTGATGAREPGIRIRANYPGMEIAIDMNVPYKAGLYTVEGRLLQSCAGTQPGILRVSGDVPAAMVYMVRVTTANGTLCRHVIIR